MPKVGQTTVAIRTVYCPACHRAQVDHGKRATCLYCGTAPLPSYQYPEGCAFYPKTNPLARV